MWQSLAFGPNYKSAYCQAVCPAGDDVIGPYLSDKAQWRRDVVVPLLRSEENVYVTSGSRAERVARRNPSKRVRYVDYQPRLSTPANFVLGLRHRFDRTRAAGVSVRVELRFTERAVLVTVEGGALAIDDLETAPDPPAAAVVELLDNDVHPAAPPRAGPHRRRARRPTAWPATQRRSGPCSPACRDLRKECRRWCTAFRSGYWSHGRPISGPERNGDGNGPTPAIGPVKRR